MSHISKVKFEHRGGYGCSNSNYSFSSLSCCGSVGVEDEEPHHFYFNPVDLSKKLDLWEDQLTCPFCGAASFQLLVVAPDMPASHDWSWALG